MGIKRIKRNKFTISLSMNKIENKIKKTVATAATIFLKYVCLNDSRYVTHL